MPSTRQNIGTRQTLICRVSGPRQTRALGKYCQRHNGPNAVNFAECQALGTRQIIKFGECHGLALGNFFLILATNFFSVALQQYQEPHIQILHILTDFFYISLVYSILLIFSENTSLNCKCIEYWIWMIRKMTFMFVSVSLGQIQELTWNFYQLAHGATPPNCVRVVF